MAYQEKISKSGIELYFVTIENNCHRVGRQIYTELIPIKVGGLPPKIGDVISESDCNILDPDQSCDYCGYNEIESISEVILLNDSKIKALKIENKVDEILNIHPAFAYEDKHFEKKCLIVVPDFNEISFELIEYFSSHPDELHNLHWRKFEELLEAIFRNQGFDTILGTGQNDRGIDLRLISKDSIGEIITLVQAKRYASQNPISLEAVAALSAMVDVEEANRGLFVTTSRYLPSARSFADKKSSKLILSDSSDVSKWCEEVCKKKMR